MPLPTVALDTTFAELYARDADETPLPVFLPFFPSTEVDLSDTVPKVQKYLYHDTSVNPSTSSPDDMRAYASYASAKYLGLLPQRFAFTAGAMPTVLFGTRPKVFDQLPEHQRPRVRMYDGPDDVQLQDGERLAASYPIDQLERLPHLVDPETHYELLSKRGLALSGLTTPAAIILDLDPNHPVLPGAVVLVSRERTSKIGHTMRLGEREEGPGWIELGEWIRTHEIPFVVKLQQSVSGAGTWLATSESSRSKIASELPDIAAHYITKVSSTSNAHLLPASLIFTSLVPSDAETIPLNFFLTRSGTPIFLGSTRQIMSAENEWSGSFIHYPSQKDLEKRLDGTMRDIARWLYGRGYYGPVGADVMEESRAEGGEKVQWVVDLNVRTPSSMVLALLSSHFTSLSPTPLPYACLLPDLRPQESTFEAFAEKWSAGGRCVCIGWLDARDEDEGRAWASVVLGAEDEERLENEVKRMREVCGGGSGDE
ncbi:hypothetical protein EXIGLDRAFT_744267 [Exidia glandulosa HHB12029]|uniref:ATP-grasp domain-containing protein n=1 Tax=Exidia glandulosa HHB12029 TaxID=1314781 RepID=A0A165Q588_EXIGL|nr:hypothetical protein EXIGLDRAFT_744267 [Exidia glandulosa HHB12029]